MTFEAKMKHFITFCVAILCGVILAHIVSKNKTHPSVSTNTHIAWWESPADRHQTTFQEDYTSNAFEPDLGTLQCPIPMKDRVRNYTGIQCVFSSIEMLGRWAEEPKLTNPPITSRSDCKGYSGPSDAASKLRSLGVKFEQSYYDRDQGIKLIKKSMEEGRGCLWGVPGHAMVLVHYSEEEDRVCWVDNSDRSLKIQETTIAEFKRRWDSWVLVIYADEDIVPMKIGKINLPIVDRLFPGREYPRDYIPRPSSGRFP